MLVLSRKVGEEIAIGENVTVEVVRIGRGNVRLGITAPRRVPIRRPKSNGRETPKDE